MSATIDPVIIAAIEAAIATRQANRAGQETKFLCPAHDDHHPSARWNPKKQCWFCDACGGKGGAIDLAKRLGIELSALNGGARPAQRRYAARAADDGRLVGYHVRIGDGANKQIWWERPDGTKGLDGFLLADLALYGADELPDEGAVVVVEGEKARDALRTRGITAVATMTGAGTTPSETALRPLLGRDVILWPDNDADGRRHMGGIARRLLAMEAAE